MAKVTNISSGPRGIHDAGGALTWLEPGESTDITLSGDTEPGEWFDFDGVRAAPASAAAASASAAAAVAALTERAENAELERDVALEQLAALRKSAPVVAAAVAALDPNVDTHWTKAGEPAVDAVKAIVGGDVSRADIDAAAPAFSREAAKGA